MEWALPTEDEVLILRLAHGLEPLPSDGHVDIGAELFDCLGVVARGVRARLVHPDQGVIESLYLDNNVLGTENTNGVAMLLDVPVSAQPVTLEMLFDDAVVGSVRFSLVDGWNAALVLGP
jgi:hypothetical protein